MSDLDALRRTAQYEHSQNQGWQNTNTWDAAERRAYEAERDRLRRQESEKK